MHNQNLIIVDDTSKFTIHPDLFSAFNQNIGVFGENKTSNNTLLKNIITQAIKLELAVFGINISKILDSKFYKWQTQTVIESKITKSNSEIWGIDDDSGKRTAWIDRLVIRASQFDKSILFVNDSTPLLRNPKVSQYLGSLCASSTKYGLQVVLTAESSHNCSQKIIKNLGNRFIVLSEFSSITTTN